MLGITNMTLGYFILLQVGSQENTDAELLQEEFTTELRCILKEEEEDKDETCSPESKRLKLKISHGKVVSSSVDKVLK